MYRVPSSNTILPISISDPLSYSYQDSAGCWLIGIMHYFLIVLYLLVFVSVMCSPCCYWVDMS